LGVRRGLRLKGLLAFGAFALWLGYAVPTAGVASGPSLPGPPVLVASASGQVMAIGAASTPDRATAAQPRAAVRREVARLLASAAAAATAAGASGAGTAGGLSYTQLIQGTATSYCLTGRTATGTQAGPGSIAVDPTVIRLGSHLYVTGYGYGWAVDTGSAIKGTLIDVWYPCDQAIQWGRRAVTIYVLAS